MATQPAPDRHDPPLVAPEKTMLSAFLDYHRATLLWKVSGLSEEQLRQVMTPSGVSLLGMVKHLGYVERWWLHAIFAGEEVAFPWTREDPDADWRVEEDEHAEQIIQFYRTQVEHSRAIAETASLDQLATRSPAWSAETVPSLRWILLHLIEETARHNGHADLLREALDGATGE